MRPEDLDKQIKRMRSYATANLDARVYATLSIAASEPGAIPQVAPRSRIWTMVTSNRVAQMAAAAGLIIALVAAGYAIKGRTRSGRPTPPVAVTVVPRDSNHAEAQPAGGTERLANELALAEKRFANKDVDGLIELLNLGLDQTKARVAGFLGRIGDERAVPALQRLADQWQGPVANNPFQSAVGVIRQKAEQKLPSKTDAAPVSGETTGRPIAGTTSQTQAGTALAGRVVDAAGRPIAGARVLAGEDYAGGDWALADANGCFAFAHLGPPPRGAFLLTAQASGFAPQRKEIAFDPGLGPIDFSLKPGTHLAGRIADANGTPLQGARLDAEEWDGWRTVEWQSTTDKDGRFAWDSAPSDSIWVRCSKPGYREWKREVNASNQEQTFLMARPFVVKGIVFDGRTGETIKQFKVTPGTQPSGDRGSPVWQTLDKLTKAFTRGRYEYAFASEGRAYAVRIEADGYIPAESQFMDANQQEATFDANLIRALGPAGYVVDAEGRPVEGAEVLWEKGLFVENGRIPASDRDQRVYVTTDRQGHFSFKPLDRQYPLVALSDQGIGSVSQASVNQEVVITIRSWARVTGDLHIGTHAAAAREIRIEEGTILGSVWRTDKVTTDQDGRFTFDRVYPGEFRLCNGVYKARPGQTIELHLGGTGWTVCGELMMPGQSEGVLSPRIRLVPLDPDVPFDMLPRPEGFDHMTYKEVEAWLGQLHDGGQGKADAAAYGEGRSELKIETEVLDRKRFRVDNVGPGRYALCGTVSYSVHVYNRLNILMRGPGHPVWYEFEVPQVGNRSQLDVPIDLGSIPVLNGRPEPGDQAPALELATFGPRPINLSDYRGRFVLVCFYNAPDEGQSSPVLETLKALSRQYHDHPGFAMLGVFQSKQSLLLDKKALEERGLDWPHGIVHGPNCKVFVEYDVRGMPRNVLIDPDGKIQATEVPIEELSETVAKAMAGT